MPVPLIGPWQPQQQNGNKSWLDYLMAGASGALRGMDWYNRNVPQRILGTIGSDPAQLPEQMQGNVQFIAPRGMGATQARVSKEAQAMEQAMQGMSAPERWQYVSTHGANLGTPGRLMAEAGADPLSYVGFGLPGKAAGALRAGEEIAPFLRPAIKGLEGAQKAEDVYTAVANAPFKLAGAGLKKLLPFQTSKVGQLNTEFGKVVDATHEAVGLGHTYKGIDVTRSGVGAWPGKTEIARGLQNQTWKEIDQQILGIDNPVARNWALRLRTYAEVNASRWGSETTAKAEWLKNAGEVQAADEAWQAWHRQVSQLQASVKDTIGNITHEGIPQTKDQLQAATRLTADTLTGIRDTVSRFNQDIMAAKSTMQPQEWAAFKDQSLQQRSDVIQGLLKSAEQRMEDVYYPGARSAGQPTFPEVPALEGLQKEAADLEARAGGMPSFFGRMSDVNANVLKENYPAIQHYAGFVERDQNHVRKVFDAIEARHPGLDFANIHDSKTALERAKGVAMPYEYKDLTAVFKRWSDDGMDLLRDDPLQLTLHRQYMDMRAAAGIKRPGPLMNALTMPLRLWKEQILVTPRFHLTNTTGMVGMSAVSGVSPAEVAANTIENAAHFIKTGEVRPPSMVRAKMGAWEQTSVPHEVGGGMIQDMMSDTAPGAVSHIGPPDNAWSKVPLPARAVMGAIPGGMAGAGASNQYDPNAPTWRKGLEIGAGAALGATVGGYMPKIVQFNRGMAASLEDAARTTAWAAEKQKTVQSKWPEFIKNVRQDLMKVRPMVAQTATTGVQTVRHTPQQVEQIADALKAYNGMIGPQELSRVLMKNGVGIDDTTVIVKRLSNLLQEGDVAGARKSNQINFNYANTDNLEEWLRQVVPFLIWPKRAIPFFLQAVAEHPGIAMGLKRYNELSAEDAKNLPRRYQGMVQAGKLGDYIAQKIFGVKGTSFVNPVSMLMPFGDIQPPQEGASFAKQAMDMAGQFGFGLSPLIKAPLTATGIFGNAPQPDFLRYSELVKGLTGTDVEASWQAPAGRLQTMLTGKTASDPAQFQDYLIKRRLQEKSVEQTGMPMQQQYMQAMDEPSSPLYQQARAEVQRQGLGQSAVGMVSPVFTRPISAVEALASQEKAGVPQTPRNEWGNVGPMGAPQAWEQFQQGNTNAWDSYTRRARDLRQDTTRAQEQYLGEHPLAQTYGEVLPPVNATDLYNQARAYAQKPGASAGKVPKAGPWLLMYLYWLQDRGHNTKKGDIGSAQDIEQFMRERGQ